MATDLLFSSCRDSAILALQIHPTVRRQREKLNALKFDHFTTDACRSIGDHYDSASNHLHG